MRLGGTLNFWKEAKTYNAGSDGVQSPSRQPNPVHGYLKASATKLSVTCTLGLQPENKLHKTMGSVQLA